MWSLGVFFFVILCGEHGTLSQLRDRGPGPWVKPTKGEPWPKPQQIVNYDGFLVVRPTIFKFKVLQEDCDILRAAIARYYRIIQQTLNRQRDFVTISQQKTWKEDPGFRAYLDSLEIRLMAPCEEYPYLNMDEHYELSINSPTLPGATVLTSQSIWGILRGLETFSQLLYLDPDTAMLRINSSAIMDFPRYSHRGLLLDTSRHFFPLPAILRTLDGMEANKLNVFHWHIVDDTSFPYQSAAFPELSEMGAYNQYTQVYTREDIRYVIEYARLRGIRVIAEFDTPGHTQSWGLGKRDLLTPCYKGDTPDGTFGPINPIYDSTYKFMETFLAEAVELFPEKYIHLGGDEVSFDCWFRLTPRPSSAFNAASISSLFLVPLTTRNKGDIFAVTDTDDGERFGQNLERNQIISALNGTSLAWSEVTVWCGVCDTSGERGRRAAALYNGNGRLCRVFNREVPLRASSSYPSLLEVTQTQQLYLVAVQNPLPHLNSQQLRASNPDIKKYMEIHNITGNYAKLEEVYIQRLVDITSKLKASSLVWQEVFDNGVNLPEDTVVHIWTGNQQAELSKVTGKGYPVLLSTCWYLSEILSGGDWQKYYLCDPNIFDGTEEQKRLVMGGEVCMWSEYVDASSMSPRVWPRASAAAEKLWSAGNVTDINDAARRLEEHTCRMNLRDIPAQPPNGPSTCPYVPYYHSEIVV